MLQNGTPGVSDQDKVWFELDANGRPVSIKVFWNGNWRRVYNGMMGEVRGYTGNPGDDFDSTGWGKKMGEYDGWHLCNGNDGAPDFSDQFLIGAHMNNDGHSGYVDSEWVSWVGDTTGDARRGSQGFHYDRKLLHGDLLRDVPICTRKIWSRAGARSLPDAAKPLWGQPSLNAETKNFNLPVTPLVPEI